MKFDIVVPVYNSLDFVKELLHSIEGLDTSSSIFELFLVDDCSDQETALYLECFAKENDFTTLITNSTNLGYTKSLNRGLRKGCSKYVIQVNSDCILPTNFLNMIGLAYRENPDLFALSPMSNAASWQSVPRTVDSDGRLAVNGVISNFSVSEMSEFCSRYNSGLAEGQLLNGFCVAYVRRDLELIGLPDEDAFPRGYGEEDDLHIRAANLGYSLAVATNCYVFHHKTKSFSSDERERLVVEGRKTLNDRYGDSRVKRLADSMRVHPRLEYVRLNSRSVNPSNVVPVSKYLEINWNSSLENRDDQLISIVMPVYQGADMTCNAIRSIFEHTSKDTNFEVVVVDNGSDAACREKLKLLSEKYPLKLVRSETNLNFSMGCNLGFLESIGGKVVFVNNDMLFPEPSWLDGLVKHLEGDHIGAVGIKLLYEDQEVQSSGLVWGYDSNFPIDVNKGESVESVTGVTEFSATTGACIGLRAGIFASVGGFDPLFVNGSEDLDLCMKLKVWKNLRVLQNSDTYAIHLESKSPGRGKHVFQNRQLFCQRWSGYLGLVCGSIGSVKPADSYPLPLRMNQVV